MKKIKDEERKTKGNGGNGRRKYLECRNMGQNDNICPSFVFVLLVFEILCYFLYLLFLELN